MPFGPPVYKDGPPAYKDHVLQITRAILSMLLNLHIKTTCYKDHGPHFGGPKGGLYMQVSLY